MFGSCSFLIRISDPPAKNVQTARWKQGLLFTAMIYFAVLGISWTIGLLARWGIPEFSLRYITDQGFPNIHEFILATLQKRLDTIGSLATLLGLFVFILACMLQSLARSKQEGQVSTGYSAESFLLLLALIGGLLVLAPEYLFLRDQFGNRMNTIFKFYYQAWIVWSMLAGVGTAILLRNLSKKWNGVFRLSLLVVLFMALVYPVLGLLTKTDRFRLPAFRQKLEDAVTTIDPSPLRTASAVWTLDGSVYYRSSYPEDLAAVTLVRNAPYGIIVEASKPDASYSDYARFSTYSGLPTVLGWPMHEGQWRGSYTPQGNRQEDIKRLYETNNWEEAQAILSQYDIRYVCVGTLEQSTYHLSDNKFILHLSTVFSQGEVTIYEVQ
jgi:uncharacterized membrane protein